jgi:ATP dependent DNA ligase domain
MLATAVDELPTGGYGYEPKWDGWRALLFRTADGAHLQSRNGRMLSARFPELTRLAREALRPGTVLDGELVVWEPARGRTNFTLLQRRLAGGSALREAQEHPAHFVAFDLLERAGTPLLAEPFARRRELLESVLRAAPTQLSLCPHTRDVRQVAEWLRAWPALGVEGIVAKALDAPYRPGRRGWYKLRQRHTTEAIVGGVTGTVRTPLTILLGRFDPFGRLRFVGRSKRLSPEQQRLLAPALTVAGRRSRGGMNHPWPCPLPAGWSGHFEPVAPLEYQQVAPAAVVEILVDTAYEHQRWRHAVDFIGLRAELDPTQVPLWTVERLDD